jgi:phosphomevalonate kinase
VATNQHQELIIKSLLAARDACLEIRLHMREMGIAAGVPVRSPLQNCKYCSIACSKKYIQYDV